jgi:hypothetical protein
VANPVAAPEQPKPKAGSDDSGAERSAAERPRLLSWRRWLPWVLIVLATVIALVSALNVWVKRQALNTDNWTNASGKLLENQQIRNAISVYIVDQVYSSVDVTKRLEQQLPPRAKGLAAPLAGGLQQAAYGATNRLLGRPKVQQLWRNANRRAHELFMDVINGKHGALVQSNGNVVLDLKPILLQVAQSLGLSGQRVQNLPPDAAQIVIMKGNQLDAARKAVKVIRVMSYFLFFLVLALYAGAMYIARGRRRTFLLAAGFSVLSVGLIVLVVRKYAGDYLVNALVNNPDEKHPVTAAWAIGTELLRNVGVNALVYGIVIVFAAWVAGPSRPATWIRRTLAPTMRNHPVVIYAAVALVLLLVLLTGPTDAQRIYPLLILFGFAFVGTEVLRRQTLREFPAPT